MINEEPNSKALLKDLNAVETYSLESKRLDNHFGKDIYKNLIDKINNQNHKIISSSNHLFEIFNKNRNSTNELVDTIVHDNDTVVDKKQKEINKYFNFERMSYQLKKGLEKEEEDNKKVINYDLEKIQQLNRKSYDKMKLMNQKNEIYLKNYPYVGKYSPNYQSIYKKVSYVDFSKSLPRKLLTNFDEKAHKYYEEKVPPNIGIININNNNNNQFNSTSTIKDNRKPSQLADITQFKIPRLMSTKSTKTIKHKNYYSSSSPSLRSKQKNSPNRSVLNKQESANLSKRSSIQSSNLISPNNKGSFTERVSLIYNNCEDDSGFYTSRKLIGSKSTIYNRSLMNNAKKCKIRKVIYSDPFINYKPCVGSYDPNYDFISSHSPSVLFNKKKVMNKKKFLLQKMWGNYEFYKDYKLVNLKNE